MVLAFCTEKPYRETTMEWKEKMETLVSTLSLPCSLGSFLIKAHIPQVLLVSHKLSGFSHTCVRMPMCFHRKRLSWGLLVFSLPTPQANTEAFDYTPIKHLIKQILPLEGFVLFISEFLSLFFENQYLGIIMLGKHFGLPSPSS